MTDQFGKARHLAQEKYGEPIAEGRHRVVFRDGDFVVKVPTRESGVHACEQELSQQGGFFARTSLDPLGAEVALPVVRMEYAEHTGYSKTPDWTWSIDCGQVGLTKDGRLVAYDWERY